MINHRRHECITSKKLKTGEDFVSMGSVLTNTLRAISNPCVFKISFINRNKTIFLAGVSFSVLRRQRVVKACLLRQLFLMLIYVAYGYLNLHEGLTHSFVYSAKQRESYQWHKLQNNL